MAANYPAWQAYMESNDLISSAWNPPSIVLVRGWIRAPQWAIAAFKSEGRTTTGILRGGFYAAEGRVGWQFTEQVGMYKQCNYGPQTGPDMFLTSETDPPRAEECIFVSYYKIKYRVWRWGPKVIQAAAGPDQLPPSDPAQNAGPEMASEEYQIEEENPNVPVRATMLWHRQNLTTLTGANDRHRHYFGLYPGRKSFNVRICDNSVTQIVARTRRKGGDRK